MYTVEYSQKALDDLKKISLYISKTLSNPQAAYNFAEKIIEKADALSIFPYGRPVYMPIRNLNHEYRVIYIKNYALFYWIDEDNKRVIVSRIVYSRRDLESYIK